MAEFLNKKKEPAVDMGPDTGFDAMGKPIPFYRREAGYQAARSMGVSSEDAFAVVNAMCPPLERDEPYGAMEAGMKYVDLTGTYRMMATLLAAEKPA